MALGSVRRGSRISSPITDASSSPISEKHVAPNAETIGQSRCNCIRSARCRFEPWARNPQTLIPMSMAAATSVPMPPTLFSHLPTPAPMTLTNVIRKSVPRTAGNAISGLSISTRARGPHTYKPIPVR